MAEKKKFAFMIHPLIIEDFGRRIGKIFGIGEEMGMKILPKKLSEKLLKNLPGRFDFTVCSCFDVYGQAEGYIIAVLLTGRQMLRLPSAFVEKRIMDAIIFAQDELGVARVGLGAYTAPKTDNGEAVISHPRIKCAIIHGDALSAASSYEAITQIAEARVIDFSTKSIAVVGAYGIVGRPAALLLAELNPKRMILTGPNEEKLTAVKKEMGAIYGGEILISSDNSVIKDADIIVLSTTSTSSIVTPAILR